MNVSGMLLAQQVKMGSCKLLYLGFICTVKQQNSVLQKGRALKVHPCSVGKMTGRCQWRKPKHTMGLITLGMIHRSIHLLGILRLQVYFDFSFNYTHRLALPQGFGQRDLPET